MKREIFKPATQNAPAKQKDDGVIALVKAGAAAYNAKSGELLLLPTGLAAARALCENIERALFQDSGLQSVDCGSDEAIFSLAERYVREWKDQALSYCDTRHRELRLLGWREDEYLAFSAAELAMSAIISVLRESRVNFNFVEEIRSEDSRFFSLLCQSGPGTIDARLGFVCTACGKLLLPDSPIDFPVRQPGVKEPEESMSDIETPGANTIAALCSLLDIRVERTVKAMLYVAMEKPEAGKPSARRAVASFVRGDFNVSMNKLARYLNATFGLGGLRIAEKPELYELVGDVAGYCGPVGLPDNVIAVCDNSVAGAKNIVAGANRPGFHRTGCCHGRDFDPPMADIAACAPGTPCPCGGAFESASFRESGEIRTGAAHVSERRLSFRDRDGSHEYPGEWGGSVSIERLLLATGLA
ncbi:MAG: hypothetical protein LBT31_00565 [Synergistaceae bacterium]|jgi:prolyl-tRNA synthetase|nr:hypothetical protein [Synergistaceae bacterium]